jgi:hypothetical protein
MMSVPRGPEFAIPEFALMGGIRSDLAARNNGQIIEGSRGT